MRFLVSQIFYDGRPLSSTKDFEAGNANPVDKSFVAWLQNLVGGEKKKQCLEDFCIIGLLIRTKVFWSKYTILQE